ncbi:hypothetical protein A3860_17515 [Niastella vici]|uniref:Uncharacterized protein n=1 Tax=Niastella vici TaxID=1703345 RepID=A0A1V9G4B2_9BACT|nr:hypothetical protein [Niastella vici]OQP65463.1 hypothetical protein A3860_17515 [Niastella vici]
MITDAKARDLATLWHTGDQSALYQFATQSYYRPEKSVLYLWEILQQLQNEYFLPCPYSLTGEQRYQLEALKSYFENEIKSCTYLKIEYKKHPVYGYLYPDAVAGADDFAAFETVKVPV